MFNNERQVQIEWGDCDPAGIVFYPRYFALFDASTAALFAAMGYSVTRIREELNDVGFPMVDTRAQFFQASTFGDEVVIKSDVMAVGRSSFEIRHQLFKGADTLAVECVEKRVWTSLDASGSIKAKPIPDDVRQRMLMD